jgi:hypothetical protein
MVVVDSWIGCEKIVTRDEKAENTIPAQFRSLTRTAVENSQKDPGTIEQEQS